MKRTRVGAFVREHGSCEFVLWAPRCGEVELRIFGAGEQTVSMIRDGRGYHRALVENAPAGTRYAYRVPGGRELPDPAARFQPEGVHAPSQVVDLRFDWTDSAWRGRPLRDYVLYELHPGTFTPEGTFDAAIAELDRLADLGITAIELMPVASVPGERNWGYDGVGLYATHAPYGGPRALQRFVDACHARSLAVVLDVVYNHLGPEGNYLGTFGSYYSDAFRTPWGEAINFDGPHSEEVRSFFIENALASIEAFHFDGLRLDAVQTIFDRSPYSFLEELADEVRAKAAELGRTVVLMAETHANDPRLVRPSALGGYGLDAVWSDDLHHALHAAMTGERAGYYSDFGSVDRIARAFRDGFAYAGEFSSHYGRRQGRAARDVPPERFVVFSQNHDQVGNRPDGARLGTLVGPEGQKVAAAIVLLSPFTPLLFMGEEYGESAPFHYFIDHGDASLTRAVREGRRREYRWFGWSADRVTAPDPDTRDAFERSRLTMREGSSSAHEMESHYRALLQLRRELLPLYATGVTCVAHESARALSVLVHDGSAERYLLVFHVASEPAELTIACSARPYAVVLTSSLASTTASEGRFRFAFEGFGVVVVRFDHA